MTDVEGFIPQAEAIPFREADDGSLEVLITRRLDKRKWGVPTGIFELGNDTRKTVRIESREEAGVDGRISREPAGSYIHHKWGMDCHIQVYLLLVTEEHMTYDEQQFRERRWVPWREAVTKVGRKPLREFIARLPDLIAETGF